MLHDGTNQSSTTVVDTFGTRRADTIFQQIGAGECGSVWAWHDTHEVNKCQDAAASSTTGRSLRNEYDMHLRVLKSLEKVMAAGVLDDAPNRIVVPGCCWYKDANDRWSGRQELLGREGGKGLWKL